MNFIQKIKRAIQLTSSVKLTNEPLLDGSLIEYSELKVGADIVLLDAAGNSSLLANGEYKTKSGLKFTIANGVFASVDDSAVQKPASTDNPIPQAQAKADEPATSGDTATGTTQSSETEVKQSATTAPEGSLAEEATETPADEIAEDAAEIAEDSALIDLKLRPVWKAIEDIQAAILGYPAFFQSHKETLEAVNQIAQTVTKLSKQPAGSPIETEITSFRKPVPPELTNTKAYRMAQAFNKQNNIS